jgi:hypothetical protein
VLLGVLLSFVIFYSAGARFHDPDLWWHLKVGERIWQTGSLPTTDEFSFTTGSHEWIPHGWLVEAMLYGCYRLGGYPALLLWLCLMGSAVVVALYALCALYSGNSKVALLGGLAGWFFATISLAIRPLLVGHLLLVLELIVLYLGRTRRKEWLWALPPLFAIWVNCHGSFAFGLVVLGVHLFTSHIDLRAGLLVSTRWERPKRLLLAAMVVLCCLALLANPFGFRLAAYPLDLYFQQTDNLANIDEWRPLNFQEPRGMGVFALMLAAGLIVLVRRKEIHLDEVLLVALGSFMAVRHTRMVFVFGILVAPLLCRLLADLWRGYEPGHDFPRLNAALALGAAALVVTTFPRTPEIEAQVAKQSPVKAVEFIRSRSLAGPMLNEYVWGGYLIWALPEHKVFIDGRTDIFDWTGVLAEYLRWYTLRDEPLVLLDRYNIGFCLLSRSAPLARVLPLLPGWKQIYADDLAVVFQRNGGAEEETRAAEGDSHRVSLSKHIRKSLML